MKSAHVNGIELAYEDHGSGEAVLCVHGFPLSHELWAPISKALGDRYRFIMPDLRGMGKSEATDRASMQHYAEDLAALLDHLGIQIPVTIMGLSMGGYIVFEFARRFPDRVKKLILADTMANADSEEKKKERITFAEKVLSEGSALVAERMIPALFAKTAPSELVEHWRSIMSATPAKGVAAALHAMANRHDSTKDFKNINVPTLVVVGEEDAITPPSAAKVMSDGIPGARLEIIPRVGHMVPVEAPTEFHRIVDEFLSS